MSRLTGLESIMWRVATDPLLRSDFANLTLVDGLPDRAGLHRWLARAAEALPRLRESVACAPLGLRPCWVVDEHADPDQHLRWVTGDVGGEPRHLLDLTARLTSPPLPEDRPPWEIIVIGGLQDGRAAIVQRAHHSLLDGWEGMNVLRTLLHEATPASSDGNGSTTERSPHQPEAGWIAQLTRHTLDVVPQIPPPAAVGDLARQVRGTTGLILSQALAVRPLSPLMRHRSNSRRFEVISLCRQTAQRASKLLGGNLNVFFICGLTGGLGAYHQRMGVPCPALRVGIPVGLHRGDGEAGGNHFSPLRLVAPTDPHPVRRFRAVREIIHRSTTQAALALTEPLAELVNLLPDPILLPAVRVQARSTDLIASFLPGPRGHHRWAGANITANYPFGPLFGAPVNATAVTLGDHLHIGLHLDPVAVTETAVFMECLHVSFEELIAAGIPRQKPAIAPTIRRRAREHRQLAPTIV
jgi:WS/DGAT/MGAT family acyltransferase